SPDLGLLRGRGSEIITAAVLVRSRHLPPPEGNRPLRRFSMSAVTRAFLTEQLELADQLLAGRETMVDPQDLPGRYGRVVKAVDHLLQAIGAQAVLGGGWAVWRHGFLGRVTQDMDIVLAADRIEEFLQVAAVSGFEVLPQPEGHWPKVRHKDTDVKVDIL